LANKLLRQITVERDYLGKTLSEVFPEMEPGLLEIYQKVYQTGEHFVGEAHYKRCRSRKDSTRTRLKSSATCSRRCWTKP
jgi:hypothetical protein